MGTVLQYAGGLDQTLLCSEWFLWNMYKQRVGDIRKMMLLFSTMAQVGHMLKQAITLIYHFHRNK